MITELVDLGLLAREADRLHPVPPRIAVESLIQRRLRGMESARRAAESLAFLYERHSSDAARRPVDVISDQADIALRELQHTARQQVRTVWSKDGWPDGREAPVQPTVLHRVICPRSVLDHERGAAQVTARTAAGEQIRIAPSLAIGMVIADDHSAVVLSTPEGWTPAYLVHRSPLLTALAELFELLWMLSMPIAADGDRDPANAFGISPDDLRMASMLAVGMKDPAIARQLGLSTRTVQRRFHVMSETVGARSRLDLLLRLSRHGLLPRG